MCNGPCNTQQVTHPLAYKGGHHALLQVEERKRLNDQLHRRYGYCQFLGGEYEEAMAHFGMCSDASPVVLLRLFPSLVSPEALKPLLRDTPGTPLLSLGICFMCSEVYIAVKPCSPPL